MPKEKHFFDVYKEIFDQKNKSSNMNRSTNNKMYKTYKSPNQQKYKSAIKVTKKKKSKTKYIVGAGTICLVMVIGINAINNKKDVVEDLNDKDSYNISKEIGENSNNNYNKYSNIAKNKDERNENNLIVFNVGTGSNMDQVNNFLNNTYEGELINKYAKMYGISPNLAVAICAQESGMDQNNYGAATGLFSLENIGTYNEWIYNYDSNEVEEITVDSNFTYILENNVKWAIALMRKKIDYFDGNIYAALQAYNFSEYMVDYILNTNDFVLNGYTDYSFIPYMKDASDNPYKYGVDMESYGDGNYIENVLRFCPESIITYKYKDNEITVNLATAKVLDVKKTEYNNQKSR